MNTLETLRAFFGWCSAINIGLLILSTILMLALRGWASRIHARMFNLGESDISRAYFQFLALYKLAILVFNLVPYFALRIVV